MKPTMTSLADAVRRAQAAFDRAPTTERELALANARIRYLQAELRAASAVGFIARSPLTRQMMDSP